MIFTVAVLVAYLLGSLSGSLLIGRFSGVDIRQSGSGNAGGTNALRTRGWRFALGVVLIDIGKGVLAGLLPQWLAVEASWVVIAPYACVLAAVAGHVWPVFFGFRGGKGAATLIGGLIVIWPLSLLAVIGTWLVVLVLTGYVGLATILAACALIPMAYIDPSLPAVLHWGFALAAALFITWTHRENLRRLRQGNENRFEKVRIFAGKRAR